MDDGAQPDEFDQFGVGADHALDTRRNRIAIDGKKAGIETAQPCPAGLWRGR